MLLKINIVQYKKKSIETPQDLSVIYTYVDIVIVPICVESSVRFSLHKNSISRLRASDFLCTFFFLFYFDFFSSHLKTIASIFISYTIQYRITKYSIHVQ